MFNTLEKASEDVYREVRKLEARLNDYLEDESLFIKSLRSCIVQLKLLHDSIEKSACDHDVEKMGEIMHLKIEGEKALSDAISKEGKAEHERSHLLESYGALILALQNLEKRLPGTE